MKKNWSEILYSSISYILVAVAASAVTFALCSQPAQNEDVSKLEELENLLQTVFIGEADKTAMEDGAADGMIAALGDRWSYYIPADEYEAYLEQMNNAYVGIGVTITVREDKLGFDILQVEPGSPARDAGLLPGDIITAVEGEDAYSMGANGARDKIRGEEGTSVNITVQRDGASMDVTLIRKSIQVQVAAGQMLDGNIGYVAINNFDSRCAEESIAAIDALVDQGATALIFDIRNNPGGYKNELVKLLDYLLPQGDLFRSLSNDGSTTVDTSDANCLELPMAVLINGNTYSAAEFFAAALEEYDWAVTVGQPTTGKSYYQTSYQLSDGSAAVISIGKYFTPQGVSLAEVGGLIPGIPVEVDADTAALIYAELLPADEDPQIQAAIAYLTGKN